MYVCILNSLIVGFYSYFYTSTFYSEFLYSGLSILNVGNTIYIYTYIYIYIYIYMHKYKHTYTYMHIHIHIHVRLVRCISVLKYALKKSSTLDFLNTHINM